MTENQQLSIRLEELGGNDITQIEAPHDFRNYIVKDGQDNEIGTVSDLLFDVKSRKVRYLVITTNTSSDTSGLRKILAPIGTVDLYELDNFLVIPALTSHLIHSLPDYIAGQVNPGVENMVRLAYAGETEDADCVGLTGNEILSESDNFYDHFHFDLSSFFTTKPNKVVNGIFDDSLEAENSISELLSKGFSKNNIEVSSSKTNSIDSETTISGSVVSVKISNDEDALKVTEILDRNGSVSIYENH